MAGLAALLPFLQNIVGGDNVGPDIGVTGRNQPLQQSDDQGPIPLSNRAYIEEMMDAQKKGGQASKRSGLFGIKGTLRDVLGAVGDHYLINKGAKPIYAPKREQELLSDALAGFTQNPQAAIERAAGVNPEAAYKLFETVGEQRAKGATQQGLSDDRTYKRRQDFGNYAARLLSGAKTPEQQAYVMEVLGRRARESGIDLADILGQEGPLDEAQRTAFATGDMTVNQQQQLPLSQEKVKIARETMEQRPKLEKMREEGRMARDDPPRPRAPTRQEQAESLYRRAAKGDKEAEALFDRLYPAPKKNRFSGKSVPPGVKSKGKSGWGSMTVKK